MDPDFGVRARCGVALTALSSANRSLTMDKQQVLESVLREAAGTDSIATPRRLDHIANVLSLVLDRDVTRLGFRALRSEDPGLRGTGLEYLENVLAPAILASLRPLLDTVIGDAVRSARPKEEVVDELLASLDTSDINADAVRSLVRSQPKEQ